MRVAVVQMNSAEDKARNLSTAERLLNEGGDRFQIASSDELQSVLTRPYRGAPRAHRDHQDRIRASLPALGHRRTEILGL